MNILTRLRMPFWTILFCFFSLNVLAQQPNPVSGTAPAGGKVSGRLADAQNKPVAYATVTMMRPDSSVVNGDLTKENGSFVIEPTGMGKFLLRVIAIGYKEIFLSVSVTPAAQDVSLGKISLAPTSQQLSNFTITAEKPLVEMNVDKKTFNVEKNITSSGGSAADVLQNVPSVSVDVDGNVSLRGRSDVTILIDGKPATLLGGDVATALQSLSGSSIESVEVITNPSAKYDAQGMGGIINIITKKDKKFGLNGSASLGAGTRDKYNGSISLNLKNNKWNFTLNSSARQNRNYNHTTTNRLNHNNDTTYHTYEDNLRNFGGWFTTLGAEYTINSRNTIALTENINLMNFGMKGPSYYSTYADTLLNRRDRYSQFSGGPVSVSSSLDYKHKFKKPKQELSANVTFVASAANRKQDYTTTYYDGHENPVYGPVIQHAPGTGTNNSLNAQADFTTPFLTEKGKLEAGVKSQMLWFQSSNTPVITYPGQPEHVDSVLLNDYNYSQQTHAAYASFSDEKGKFSYQAGLRLEYADYSGTANNLGRNYYNDYLSLFPSLFITYKLAKDQSLYLSYTRRTSRPGFMQLIPVVNLSNPQDTSMGNPALRPEFIQNTELNYNRIFRKGHNIIAGVYYQYTRDIIQRYSRFYPDGTSFTQPQNLSSGITYGAELTGRLQLLPIWDATVNVNLFQNEINGTNIDPSLNNSGFSWFGKLNTNLKLPKGFSLQVNANYEAPKPAGQSTLSESWWMDVAIRKSLLNNKATIVLNVSDIFDTHKYTNTYDLPLYYQTVYRDRETRIANLTFTWRFGRSESRSPGSNGGGRRKGAQQNNSNSNQTKDREGNLKGDDSGGDNGGGF